MTLKRICVSDDCCVFNLHFWELFCFTDFIYLLKIFSVLFWRRTCVIFSLKSFVKYDIICTRIQPFKGQHYEMFSWNYLCLHTLIQYLLRLRRYSESNNKSKYLTQEVTRMSIFSIGFPITVALILAVFITLHHKRRHCINNVQLSIIS